MWWTGSVRAAPGQVLTPSAAPGTRHLGTSNITISLISPSWHVWVPLLKPWTLTAWKGQQAEEQHQDSHAMMEALWEEDGASQLGLGFQPAPEDWFALWEVPKRTKRSSGQDFYFALHVRVICLVLSRVPGAENKEQYSGTVWSSNCTWTRHCRIHTF